MSFHPHDVARRARTARIVLAGAIVVLASAFFRTQVTRHEQYALRSQENRLREVPLPAPRGIIYDRNGKIIAENVPGYSVSLLAPSRDSLRATLVRLGQSIDISEDRIAATVRRYQRAPSRPVVVLADASFDEVSVLEEHRTEFPGLIIQSAPKRFYPDGEAVSAFVGYTGEISETELNAAQFAGYKAGQQVGKGGLERQYEDRLHGREGIRFVEVDARGRVVREEGARTTLPAEAPPPLYTNIDMDLQRVVVSLWGDTLQGGIVAMEPHTGEVLAIHSAPGYDPNRFVGGVSSEYYGQLRDDPRRPLFNKAIQGRYPPASTFKLATSAIAMEDGIASLDTHMQLPCTGGMWYGSRYFKCWDKRGHGNVTLQQAIAKSCDVYFYQLGLRIGLSRLLAGGISLGMDQKSGIDLPNESSARFPANPAYYDRLYGPRGWTNAVTLNLSIGQGENDQTVVNMARFYTALATDGYAAKPEIVRRNPERQQLLHLDTKQMAALRTAMLDVVSARGTAGASAIVGIPIAGKTGTAQNSTDKGDHAWFVGFAPADDPKIVVAIMVEFGEHGSSAARLASRVIGAYLKSPTAPIPSTDASD